MAAGHLVVGVAAYQAACALFGYAATPQLVLVAACGSLLPDIDHPKSQVGQVFPGISNAVAAMFGHRGFTHSLLAVALFSLALVWCGRVGQGAVAALSIGYLSHLVADYLTLTGIPLLWPSRVAFRMPGLAFRTGGPVEYALTSLLVLLMSWVWAYGEVPRPAAALRQLEHLLD